MEEFGISLAQDSGLILAARVGKGNDQLLEEMLVTAEGKTQCLNWNTDGLKLVRVGLNTARVLENMVVGVDKAGGSRQRAEGNKFVKIFLLNSEF